MDCETVAQSFLERELHRADKSLSGGPHTLNARRDKGPDVLAQMVETKQEPFSVDVSQMIGIHQPFLAFGLPGFAISEQDLFAARCCLGQGIKNLQMNNGFGAGAKGDGLLP